MTEMLAITPVFVALFALLQIAITFPVGFRRVATNIHFYDQGDVVLQRRQRAHANFTETVPITLIAMGIAEVMGLAPVWLWLGGGALILGRSAHYLTLITVGWGNFRAVGMLLTFAAMGGFSIAILWSAFM